MNAPSDIENMLKDPEGRQLVEDIHTRKRLSDIALRSQGCSRHTDCTKSDVAFLLEELQKRDEALSSVQELAANWEARGEHDMAYSKTIPDEDISLALLTEGASLVENARHIRNAIRPTPATTGEPS